MYMSVWCVYVCVSVCMCKNVCSLNVCMSDVCICGVCIYVSYMCELCVSVCACIGV